MNREINERMIISPEPATFPKDEPILMPARVFVDFLQQAQAIHGEGLKSYGVFTADAYGSPFHVAGVCFFDSTRNQRNSPQNRAAFEAQGTYFRTYDDAGFVVDGQEMAAMDRHVAQAGQTIVAPFHSHRRQPPNFSDIDYRLHNPFFPWHLVICLREPERPVIQPFRVDKPWDEYGIDAHDHREGCELSYAGDEVRPLDLVIAGTSAELDAVATAIGSTLVLA